MVFTKYYPVGNGVKANEDCYFYFYSSCTKGDDCPYRHCKEALGTETVCTLWEEGRCFRANCKFRHMKSRVNRSQISCYWENQPGGCRKPHCVFFHKKVKNDSLSTTENQSLILPVSTEAKSPICNVSPGVNVATPLESCEKDEGIHSPVEPFVVSFDENEESDSESVSSTPVKSKEVKSSNCMNVKNSFSKMSENSVGKCLDFGIKSLEQIRLEKIHKESANIYQTDDLPGNGIENFFHDVKQNSALPCESVFSCSEFEAPTLEELKLLRSLETNSEYPFTSDFVPLPPPSTMDVEQIVQSNDAALTNVDPVLFQKQENDLRSKLKQPMKRRVPVFSKDESTKKILNIKKNNNPVDDPLNFKIKTLDEIRKEKKLKGQNVGENGHSMTSAQDLSVTQNHLADKFPSSASRKLKINRLSEKSTTDPAKKVKRKIEFHDDTSSKIRKLDSSAPDVLQNGLLNQVESKVDLEKSLGENLQPVLLSETSPNPDVNSPEPCESSAIEPSKENSNQVVKINDEFFNESMSPSSSSNVADSSSLVAEADSSTTIQMNCSNKSTEEVSDKSVNSKTSTIKPVTIVSSENALKRSLSIDELDHLLKDTDVTMEELDNSGDSEDDILSKINELLDS